MKLTFLPLLQIQRDLDGLPRGMERFREYIKTMTDAKTGDLALPLLTERPFSDPALTRPLLKADHAGRIPGPAMPLGSARTKPFHRLA